MIERLDTFLARRRLGRPGESAFAQFRRDRRQKIRSEWRLFAGLLIYVGFATGMVVVLGGIGRIVFAAMLGSALTILLFIWELGDIRSLFWLWGGFGEQATADLLATLPPEWTYEHDVPTAGSSNWDHILVGPGGVYLLDSKNLSRPAVAQRDALRSGRLVMSGGSFRGSARELYYALQARGVRPPIVLSVVVIWGDFEQRCHQEDRVVYLHHSELLGWIKRLPVKLQPARRDAIALAASQLRDR